MFIGDIKTASPFKDLFPIKEELVKTLYWDMQKNGFDESKPIVLWESHNSIVLDGHTRLKAADKAGLIQVPVVLKRFDSEDEALEYAIRCQRNRRNLTDREILNCIAELDKRKSKSEAGKEGRNLQLGLVPNGTCPGRSSKDTAHLLGVNYRKVERARVVLDDAPEEIKEAVKSGKMTIHEAFQKTKYPEKGSAEAIKLAAEEIEQIQNVFEIIKKRLNRDQMRELMKYIAQELIKGKE